MATAAPPGAPPPRWRRAADLGCGTGLMGPLLRPACGCLVGVDLSAGMVAKARARGCYDRTDVGELVAWLRDEAATAAAATGASGRQGGSKPGDGASAESSSNGAGPSSDGGGYDLLVAADVLVYIGDLRPLMAAAAAAAAGPG